MPGGVPLKAATEAVMITLPWPLGIITRRATSRVRKKGAETLRFMTLFQASSGYSSALAPQVAPALLTRMSMSPQRVSTSSTRAGMVSNFCRSLVKVSTW